MSTTTMPDSRVLLHGIRWETYERMRDDLGDSPIRLSYDQGALEIVTPLRQHERPKRLLGRMVEAMTEELRILINSGGSMTFKRRDLEKGLEPDECYWVQNEARVRDRYELDFRVDPAPDLVIEIEVTRSLVNRLGILAALGVGEVWHYDGVLTVLLRNEGGYSPSPTSRCFPWLPLAPFIEQLARADDADETTWIREFREWVARTVNAP